MSESDRPDADATEMIDLGDADVSAVDLESQRSFPPPLPPEVRASAAPPVHPSAAPPAPSPRSNRFYVTLLVAFVGVGVVAGIALALGTRGERKPDAPAPSASASASASAAASPSVMTLPTIDMTDDADGGN